MNQAPAALIHPQISEKEGTPSGWRWLTLRPPCSCDPSCSVRKQGQEICFKSNFSASSLSCHLANCDGLAFSVVWCCCGPASCLSATFKFVNFVARSLWSHFWSRQILASNNSHLVLQGFQRSQRTTDIRVKPSSSVHSSLISNLRYENGTECKRLHSDKVLHLFFFPDRLPASTKPCFPKDLHSSI